MWPRGKGHPLMSKSFTPPVLVLCWQGGSKEMCSLGGKEVRRGREGRTCEEMGGGRGEEG